MAGTVTTGGAVRTPTSEIEKSSITLVKIDFERMSSSPIQNQRPLYGMATYESGGGDAPLLMFRRDPAADERAAGARRRPAARDIALGHLGEDAELEHDLQHRPGHDRDLVGLSRPAAVADLVGPVGRAEAQEAPHLGGLGDDVGPDMRGGKADDGGLGTVLRALDADLQRIGELQLVEQLGDAREVRIAGPRHAGAPQFVGDAVHRIDRDRHDQRGGVAGLQQEQHGGRRDRRHQLLDEVVAGQRRIDHGRPVGVGRGRRHRTADRHRPADRRGVEVLGGDAGADGGLQLVARDHLGDLHEHREVAIAQLDDVEQRLLLPGIADRRAVVGAVAGHGRWTNAVAGACHRGNYRSGENC